MLLITAPSKTQKWLDRDFPITSEPFFLQRSLELIETLKPYSIPELCQLMKISSALGKSTHERIQEFRLPLTGDTSRQALFTFQGDAWAGLTPTTYSDGQLAHAQRHLRILSGLYGILRPLDLMHPYRLEMSCKLSTEKWTNLYQFWGDAITEFLNRDIDDHADRSVINLASVEYSRVINRRKLAARFITITFKQRKAEAYRTIAIHAKRARGKMVHEVIAKKFSQAEELLGFTVDGYRFSEAGSTEDNWVFVQD